MEYYLSQVEQEIAVAKAVIKVEADWEMLNQETQKALATEGAIVSQDNSVFVLSESPYLLNKTVAYLPKCEMHRQVLPNNRKQQKLDEEEQIRMNTAVIKRALGENR